MGRYHWKPKIPCMQWPQQVHWRLDDLMLCSVEISDFSVAPSLEFDKPVLRQLWTFISCFWVHFREQNNTSTLCLQNESCLQICSYYKKGRQFIQDCLSCNLNSSWWFEKQFYLWACDTQSSFAQQPSFFFYHMECLKQFMCHVSFLYISVT